MSDVGAIGVIMHDMAEVLSEHYYGFDDDNPMKSYISFSLILLKDLVDTIQKDNINLYLEDGLKDIKFFMNESEEYMILKKILTSKED